MSPRAILWAGAVIVAFAVVAVLSIGWWISPDLQRVDEQIALAGKAPLHSRMIPAIVAVEDPGYLQRSRYPSFAALAYPSSKRVYCASTLANQLVRMTLPPQRAGAFLVKQAILTTILDLRGRPGDVAQAYAHAVWFGRSGGHPVIGVRKGAEVYFGRSAEQLSPAQIAMLVSTISRSRGYEPSETSAGAIDRRLRVLAIMRERGVITHAEYDIARREICNSRNTSATACAPA